jgi:hypothetical protein
MLEQIKYQIEQKAFGLFSFLGDKLGIESRRIRLFFIYISFIAVGSPFLVAGMVVDFWRNMWQYIKGRGKSLWDL